MASARAIAGIRATMVCVGLLTATASFAQFDHPTVPLSRGPWPDELVLTGPGAQIGASFRNLTAAEAKQANSQPFWVFIDRGGVVIEQVRPDSPAARAGLVRGDRITMFDGHRVRSPGEFSRLVEETPPGQTVPMTVIRNSKVLSLSITPTL